MFAHEVYVFIATIILPTQAWENMGSRFSATFQPPRTGEQLKNHFESLKKKHKNYKDDAKGTGGGKAAVPPELYDVIDRVLGVDSRVINGISGK